MSHLKNVGMTYGQHLCFAMKASGQLLKAGLAAGVHAFVPSLFEKTASTTIHKLATDLSPYGRKSHRILVRFNTKWQEDSLGRQWRVVVDGIEELAHHVRIMVPCQTIRENVGEEPKFHFVCHGEAVWSATSVVIM